MRPAAPAQPRRRRLRAPVSGWLAAGAAALAVVLPTPYVIEAPGPALDLLGEHDGRPVLSVDGAQVDPAEGTLDMTTVMVAGPPSSVTTLPEVVAAVLAPEQDVVPRELVHPTGTTAEEVDQENAAAMTDSQDVATAAALRSLGRDVPQRLTVAGLVEGAPAAGVLHEGDEIVRAGDAEGPDTAAVREAVESAGPGPVRLTVRRDGTDVELEVPVAPTPEGAPRRWQMGALLAEDVELPVEAEMAVGDVGGPSAGLMFALAVVERLTPGAMTDGAAIAGTGTITADGRVGAIGGIPQKVRGAADAGAEWFLAPAGNCAELAGRVPEGITVHAVEDLTEARQAVEAIARGDRPPEARTCG